MRKRKRVLWWAGLLVALAGAGMIVVAWWTAPTPGITPENVGQVRYGMRLEQVERLFGRHGEVPRSRVLQGSRPNTKEWVNPETGFIVGVTFDDDGGAVEGATMSGLSGFSFIPPGSLPERIRWRLGF